MASADVPGVCVKSHPPPSSPTATSFGSADAMRTLLGVEPGSVTPFAALNDRDRQVTVVLDAVMLNHSLLNFHPLINTMTTGIARDDLVKFLRATGHEPRIEPVSGTAGPA